MMCYAKFIPIYAIINKSSSSYGIFHRLIKVFNILVSCYACLFSFFERACYVWLLPWFFGIFKEIYPSLLLLFLESTS